MKTPRLIPSLLLASTALLTACNHGQDQASSIAEIHQWMDDFQRAFQARDTKAVMALYTPDILAYDIIPPLQYNGSDAYGKDFETYFAGYKGPLTLEYRDCHISADGNLALVACLERVTGTLTNGHCLLSGCVRPPDCAVSTATGSTSTITSPFPSRSGPAKPDSTSRRNLS